MAEIKIIPARTKGENMALEVAPDYQQEYFDEGLGKAISWLAAHPKGSTLDAATAAVQAIGQKCAGKGIGGERWGEFLTAVRSNAAERRQKELAKPK